MIYITADELPRVMACNGSVKLPDMNIPKDDDGNSRTSTRQEGIAAHFMAVSVFNGTVSDAFEWVDRKAPNGVYMTAEMAEHVEEYLEIAYATSDPQRILMEHKTYLSDYSKFEVNGRTDRFIWNSVQSMLIIDDFKYGWRIVEPEDNWTLIFHAVAFCISEQIAPADITFRIIQPRPYHPKGTVRTWSIGYAELLQHYRTIVETLGALSNALNTGPQCTHCPKQLNCWAYLQAELNAIDVSSDLSFEPTLSNELLSQQLDLMTRAAAVLKDGLDARIELARHRIKQGQIVPNYAQEPVVGNRAWNDYVTGELIQALTGKDARKPADLISPAQAVKTLKIDEDLVNSLTNRPSKGFKLVRENANKRATRLLGEKS